MVKVLLTGSEQPAASKQIALSRLQSLQGSQGTYKVTTTAPADQVFFGNRQEALQRQQSDLRWKNAQEAAKKTTKMGVLVAGTILGGLLGGVLGCGLPGMIVGALLAAGIMRMRSAQKTAAPVPLQNTTNPFKLVDLSQNSSVPPAASPRAQAVERLRLEGVSESVTSAPRTQHSVQFGFNGKQYFVRNIVPGMIKKSVYADQAPILRFKTSSRVRSSELTPHQAPLLFGVPDHNVTGKMAVVTLSQQGAKVDTLTPASHQPPKIATLKESIVWNH